MVEKIYVFWKLPIIVTCSLIYNTIIVLDILHMTVFAVMLHVKNLSFVKGDMEFSEHLRRPTQTPKFVKKTGVLPQQMLGGQEMLS